MKYITPTILIVIILASGLYLFLAAFLFIADGTHDQEQKTKLTFEQKEQMCKERGMIIVLARDVYDYHYCIEGSRPWEEE